MNNENYTLLPNNLFQPPNKDTKSLYQEYKDHKILLVMDYLHVNTNRFGISIFTFEDMITFYGLKLKTGKGKMNQQFKDMIEFLQFKGIISDCNVDIKEAKLSQFIRCKYNGIEKNKEGKNVKFTTVRYEAIDWIISYQDDLIDNVKLLFYYCYLCSRIYTPLKNDNNIRKSGGRANPCFPSYETITSDIGISDKTIKQYNDILVNLNLIRIGNLGLAYYSNDKNKIPKETPNFYTHFTYQTSEMKDEDTIWYDNLKEAMKIYKEEHSNMVFIGTRDYKNNDRVVNGKISRINTLEKEGKATVEQLQERDNLIASKTYKEETITALRDQIYDIQQELIEFNKEEKYEDIEAEYDSYFDTLDLDINNIEDCKKVLNYVQDMKNKYILDVEKPKGLGKNLQKKVDELNKLREEITALAQQLIKDVDKDVIKKEVIKGRDIKSKNIKELNNLKLDFINYMDRYSDNYIDSLL